MVYILGAGWGKVMMACVAPRFGGRIRLGYDGLDCGSYCHGEEG